MSDQLITVTPDTSIDEASRLMSDHQICRLPVVQGKKLVGIVALGDFAINPQTDSRAQKALKEISETISSQLQ